MTSASPAIGGKTRQSLVGAGVVLALALLIALLLLPLLGLLLRVPPARLLARIGEPSILQALKLSLLTSLSATALVVLLGLPAAYLLACRNFPGKRFLEVLVELPMVLPPTVGGLALLLAFGRNGLAGETLSMFGLELPFTILGVVLAQTFMAVPFFIAPARAGFASVDQRYLDMASTLKATESYRFFRILLPLAMPSLLAGAAMACARALGEFGATITFAGNLPGVTETMPLAVYIALQTDLDAAVAMSVLLLGMSSVLLLGIRLAPGSLWNRTRADRIRR